MQYGISHTTNGQILSQELTDFGIQARVFIPTIQQRQRLPKKAVTLDLLLAYSVGFKAAIGIVEQLGHFTVLLNRPDNPQDMPGLEIESIKNIPSKFNRDMSSFIRRNGPTWREQYCSYLAELEVQWKS